MNKARLIITAIHAENLTQDQAARRYGVSQSWVSKLLHRHRSEGEAAFTPKSKRPHNTPTATPQSTIDLIREIRATLEKAGHDAGIINPRNERML